MALNFTISYTFSPGTTISSSQVNTNTSDVANVFTGLEALTKTFAKLKIDVDPSTALEAATKQYVDHYSTWRRPVLQWGSVTTVAVESGLDGTSGDIPMLFPDGSLRTETSTTRTTFNITRNAVLVTSGAQSGLTGATSEATNTWYSLYACKVTDSSTLWVTVGSTVIPTQANYATLNTAYGTSGWVYLGCVPNGDNSAATGDIPKFVMSGNRISLYNSVTAATSSRGVRLANTAGATSLTWTYAAGTDLSSGQIPGHILIGDVGFCSAAQAQLTLLDSAGTFGLMSWTPSAGVLNVIVPNWTLSQGVKENSGNNVAKSILLQSYQDNVLGVGSNPLL